MGSKIDFMIGQAEFLANVIAMEFYGPGGGIQQHGNLFGRMALTNQISDLNFLGRQIGIAC